MPQINLIYDKQVAVHQNERKVRGLFFTSVGIGVASVLLFGSLQLQAEVIRRDESQLNLKLSKLKPLVALTEANEKLTSSLLPRLQTLENAQKTSDKWAHILAHFTHNTPDGVWLTGVKGASDDPKKPISVTFDGKGADQKMIADLMLRAEGLPDLTNVNLKYSELRPGAEGTSIDFEVGAEVVGTDPTAAAKPTGSGT
jgi:Tfp pilus assembly protein PilN